MSKILLESNMRVNFFMNIPYIEKSYKTILLLYVISVNDLLIGLCIAIFLLLHQRKNTLFYYRRTYITYCLLSQSPHNQSVLAKSLGEQVVALYYTHYALAEPLNIVN